MDTVFTLFSLYLFSGIVVTVFTEVTDALLGVDRD